jgi:phosphoribosylamine--glycine ligase
MRVLIIGGGGREHALAWALAGSPLLTALFVAPGNPGTAALAVNVPIGVLDVAALVAFAQAERIDLVVPGPEGPLVAGVADALARAGIRCFGPTAAAAMLEGSKAFTKEIADAAGIPTASWERFVDAQAALDFVARRGAPIVIKADGLAAGKGVTVARTQGEAEAAVRDAMVAGVLGEAGATLVIEECLEGDEVSLFALCDGLDAVLLGAAQDHKRVGDGDTGPNTGGMGAVSPPVGFGPAAQAAAMDVFVRPALAEMARRGTPFRGVLFAGLMLTSDGPKLIEYNVRLGDPEAQALLPRLRTDLLTAMLAACDGELADFTVVQEELACVSIVLAARGYPGEYRRGGVITGLDEAAALANVAVFHAGTAVAETVVTAAGGRVLTVCATGADLASARASAYAGAAAIEWEDKMFRTDIGLRAQMRAAELLGAGLAG